MAESYQTEDEQVEALKRWWTENGKSTVITIVVAIAAVFGWQGYQKQQQVAIETASGIYQNLLSAVAGENGQPTADQVATANHLADTLKQDFASSHYAAFAALFKAKLAVDEGDLAGAETELRWVLEQDVIPEVQSQAQLRLARVLAAKGEYSDALAFLTIDDPAFAAQVEELRGDIKLAQGDAKAAALAYQKALELSAQASGSATKPLLSMKLEQLKSHSQAVSVEKPQSDDEKEAEDVVSEEGEA